MEVDEAVVDLSIRSSSPQPPQVNNLPPDDPPLFNNIQQPSLPPPNTRRVLRPRTEPRSYVESPDVLINGTKINGNLSDYSDNSSEGEMPPLPPPIKELSPAEIKQRERGLRRLREELRAEEMKLVLLKKLKQSQHLKENVAVLPPSIPASALPPTGLPSGLSITPTTVKVPTQKAQNPVPQAAHSRHQNNATSLKVTPPAGVNLMRVPPPRSSSLHGQQHSTANLGSRTSLSVPQLPPRAPLGRPPSNFPPGVKDLSPSVTITPAPPQPVKNVGLEGKTMVGLGNMQSGMIPEDRSREDNQTPAQRQAAAKLALRKQLEKTLLQIPPPKPPPPEMHFIPNPSNTEFIYLVGLEHVVDFLTKETRVPLPPQPFSCSQCQSDFTPVWKWEYSKKHKGIKSVICEQCVTNNVKKALKAEHTNRLKTAFVKALQQEQEIEQRLAQNGVFTSSSPAPSPVTPDALPKSITPTPTPRHAATPPAPSQPQTQPTPPPHGRSGHSSAHSSSSSSASVAQQDKYMAAVAQQQDKYVREQQQQDKYVREQQQSAAAMQALHQQILRSLSGAPPAAAAHMLQFSPLFYPYQLAMAQAAASNKGAPANLAELQRAADIQRQYLLDMIPPGPGQRHNWKT